MPEVAHAPSKTPCLRRWRKLQLAASTLLSTSAELRKAEMSARVPTRQAEACATSEHAVFIAIFDRPADMGTLLRAPAATELFPTVYTEGCGNPGTTEQPPQEYNQSGHERPNISTACTRHSPGPRPAEAGLSGPHCSSRETGGRSRLADDARREGLADDERLGTDRSPRCPGLQLVERVSPRRGPRRHRHRLPGIHRHGRFLQRTASVSRGNRDL